jgi:hypothetical protein
MDVDKLNDNLENKTMDIKSELIDMCLIFLKYLTQQYINGNISSQQFSDMKKLKIQFLQDCGVWN